MDENGTEPGAVKSTGSGFSPWMAVAGVGVIIAIGFGVSQGFGKDEAMSNVASTTIPEVVGVETEAFVDDVKTIKVEAGAFYFNPKEIRVKAGEKVRIVLTAVDMMHDFNIDELGVKSKTIKAGETDTIEFVASTAGEYEYYCSVGQHRKMGQVGKLIIE